MFKLGISYALACSPGDCAARSREQLNRLISSYPQSPYSAEARFIMSLLGDIEKLRTESKAREEQIKKLEDELARLKAIDLKRQSPTIKK
jgi:TolA-binding protein